MNGKDLQGIIDVLKKNAKDFWTWLNGKKTGLAAFYWSVTVPLLPIFWPLGVPLIVTQITTGLGIGLTALGLGHKLIKNQGE